MEQAIVVAPQPSRNRLSWRVILVVLLVAYPVLAWVVAEQGRVINVQRVLIRQLSNDSQELNSRRVNDLRNRQKASPADKAPPAGTQKPGAAPERKNRKRHDSREAPSSPQEYPGTRKIPARKSA